MNCVNVNKAASIVIVLAFTLGALAVAVPSAKAEAVEVVSTIGALPETRVFSTAVELDGSIFVFGGFVSDLWGTVEDGLDTVLIYDVGTGETAQGASMPTGGALQSAAVGIDGLVYVFGGYNASYGYVASVQIYNPDTDSWTTGVSAPTGLGGGQAVAAPDGKFYLFGAGVWFSVNSTLIYDPVSDSWEYGADQPVPIAMRSAVLIDDTSIMVCGGYNNSDGTASNLAQLYDIATDSWTYLSPMPLVSNFGGAAIPKDGFVYVLGGSTGDWVNSGVISDAIQVYDLDAGEWWVSSSSLSGPRSGAATVSDEYGRIFVVGGYDGVFAVSSVIMVHTAEISYDDFRIMSPSDGAVVSGSVTVTVSQVNPTWYIYMVDFYVDGELVESQYNVLSQFTWSFVWDTAGVLDGSTHELLARGFMTDGSTFEDSIAVTFSAYTLDERLDMLETELAALHAMLDSQSLDITALQDAVAAVNADLVSLAAQVTTVEGDLTVLAGVVGTLSGTVDDLQAALDDLASTVDEDDAALAADIAALQTQLTTLQTSLTNLQTSIDEANDGVTDVQGSVDDKMSLVMGYAILGLLVVVIVLLAMMMVMGRKATPPPPSS